MQCPVDGETLSMTERNGVEIDYCPRCRGVWLGRGELDKLIERTANAPVPTAAGYQAAGGAYGQRAFHKNRKESFLSDIFNF